MNIYVFGMLIDFKACQAKTCAFSEVKSKYIYHKIQTMLLPVQYFIN